MTPKETAAHDLYDARNRAKDALMFLENAVRAFENGDLDRAEVDTGQSVHPAQMLVDALDDARRKLRAVARAPEAPSAAKKEGRDE